MDDGRLTGIAEQLRRDDWASTITPAADVRRSADRRQRRRTTTLVVAAAIAVPAVLGGLARLTKPDDESARPDRSLSASPAPSPSTSTTPSALKTLYSSPADLELAKLLLDTDQLPTGFIALPSCCYSGLQTPPPPPADDCSRRALDGPARAQGRIAEAAMPIRYSGEEARLSGLSGEQKLSRYESPAAASAALEAYRQFAQDCQGKPITEPGSPISQQITEVTALGDGSVRVRLAHHNLEKPDRATTHLMLTLTGSILQKLTLTENPPPQDPAAETANRLLLEDFATRGAGKLAASEKQ